MKITTDDLRDEVSIHELKDSEYNILFGAVRAASSDLRDEHEYLALYGVERGEVVSFFNMIQEEDEKLRKQL